MLFIEKCTTPLKKTERLTSGQINQAQMILKKQHPTIGGLFCCIIGGGLEFPKAVGEKWLQIIHSGNNHWVLVAYGFSDLGHVLVYDSLNRKNWHNDYILSCMSSLLMTPEKEMRYIIKTVQRQSNSYDCGIFAIAFGTSLLNGQDPTTVIYDPKQLRQHLENCFALGVLSLFPTLPKKSTRVQQDQVKTIDVFCHCRRTEYVPYKHPSENWIMIPCVDCENWFHAMCDDYPAETKSDWKCKKCK